MDSILEKINRAGLKFLVPLDLETTYQTIVDEAARLVQADSGALYLGEGDKLKRVADYPAKMKKLVHARKKGFTYRSYIERKPYIVDIEDLKKSHPEFKKMNVGSGIYIPISYHKKSIGSLALISFNERKFSDKELNMLKIFGSYASLAINKAQLFSEINKAIEVRDLFISLAAHELRTPLTTITGYIQLLHHKIANSNSTEARWIAELSWESKRLTHLVNELLEVNKIKAGQFEYHWKECSLKDIVHRAFIDFKFNHPDYKIQFRDDLKCKGDLVIGDFDKLLQVFINLLDNAAKFSDPSKEIRTTIVDNASCFTVRVVDQGKGIKQDDLSRIFEGFYKGSKHNQEQGMGIGLFMAKNIITQHKGSISIKSKESRGTRVEVRLPKIK